MNTANITLPNGEKKDLYFDFNSEEFNIQYGEIFKEEHYKKGLRKKNMIVLDVGANIGLTTLYFKDHAKMIYALEPNKTYYDFLVHNVGMYKNVKTFNVGLGLETCKQNLYSNPDEERIESIFGKGNNRMEVDILAIDDFLEYNKIDHIDVMKIDTEGSEYPIFMSKGFKKIASKIDYIIGESHYFDRFMPAFIPEVLKDYGFKVKFLPFENMFSVLGFSINNKPADKLYKIFHQTIFEAKR